MGLKRKRTALADSNRYVYEGYPTGFQVKWFTFKENDGIKGVAIKWFGYGRSRRSGFYAFKSERAFWSSLLFRHCVDEPKTQLANSPKAERPSPKR